eukprot:5944684-Pleurochrysis_carterae.AAC.1
MVRARDGGHADRRRRHPALRTIPCAVPFFLHKRCTPERRVHHDGQLCHHVRQQLLPVDCGHAAASSSAAYQHVLSA